MLFAAAIAIPLGVWLTRQPRWAKPVIGVANVLQTIPSLAMFGFLLPLPWLGERAARGGDCRTHRLCAVADFEKYVCGDSRHRSDAGCPWQRRMGLTNGQRLFKVELPLAASFILAGLRTATVTCVGIATIAAAVGAGGLGELIFRGVASVNNELVLAGAIPAALLALTCDGALGLLERLVPGAGPGKAGMRRVIAVAAALVCALAAGCSPPRPNHLVIGAKNFTEQVVLGELLAQEIEAKSDWMWSGGFTWPGATSAIRH